jgi:hypothetical protein
VPEAAPGDATISDIVVVSAIPLPFPETVIVYVPMAAVDWALSVNVEEPDPGAGMDRGLKLAVVPAGRPDTLRFMVELKGLETATPMVAVPGEP